MKNLYISVLTLASVATFAQQTISFEASEGYQLGTLNQQNGWEVTEANDEFVENQIITDEFASDGTFSFKNGHEPDFGDQWFPIFGAVRTFDTPADYSNFTISYDVMATALLGADFEFTLFAVDEDEYYIPVAGVGIENRGFIYLITDENYGFEYATAEWTPNTWVNVKIEVSQAEIKYYINDALQLTIPNYSQMDIVGLNMLHNNYGNSAYYDNFVITTEALGTNSPTLSNLSVYPNPANNNISITLPENTEVSNVAIYDLSGKKVLTTMQTQQIDISVLSSGAYLLKAVTTEGSSVTKKIVKY